MATANIAARTAKASRSAEAWPVYNISKQCLRTGASIVLLIAAIVIVAII